MPSKPEALEPWNLRTAAPRRGATPRGCGAVEPVSPWPRRPSDTCQIHPRRSRAAICPTGGVEGGSDPKANLTKSHRFLTGFSPVSHRGRLCSSRTKSTISSNLIEISPVSHRNLIARLGPPATRIFAPRRPQTRIFAHRPAFGEPQSSASAPTRTVPLGWW